MWTPDGTSLLVDDVEVPLDGSTPRQLPQDGSGRLLARRIARRVHRQQVDGRLVVAAADGSDAREVVGRWVLDPVWSPTGDRIAFTYSEEDVWRSNELRVLDVATREVTPLAGMDGSVEIWNIQFSTEGDRILFARTEAEERASPHSGASTPTAPTFVASSPGRARGLVAMITRAGVGKRGPTRCSE